jgi:hypothetical protein
MRRDDGHPKDGRQFVRRQAAGRRRRRRAPRRRTGPGPSADGDRGQHQIGAAPYERSSSRTAYRNGYRTRTWGTRVGTIELGIPKVTAGTYFPSLLEPRRRAEKALQAVVVEAYVKGMSTRKVDDLSRRLGSTASRSRRCPGSAKCSTRTSRRSLLARSRQSTPTSGSMRRSTRSVKPAGSCRRVCHMEAGLQILEQVHRAVDHPAARNFLQQHDVRLESNDRVGDASGSTLPSGPTAPRTLKVTIQPSSRSRRSSSRRSRRQPGRSSRIRTGCVFTLQLYALVHRLARSQSRLQVPIEPGGTDPASRSPVGNTQLLPLIPPSRMATPASTKRNPIGSDPVTG